MKSIFRGLVIALLLSVSLPAVALDSGAKPDVKVVAPEVAKTTDAAVPVAATAAPEVAKVPPVAAPTEDLSWWKTGLKNVFELVFLILGIMATALVRVMMKKYGFEMQSGKVNDILTKAIGFAEQWSLKKLKMEGEAAPGGAKKMEMAVDFAKKLAVEYKLPNKGADWWEHKLEGWLGVDKAKAAAAKG